MEIIKLDAIDTVTTEACKNLKDRVPSPDISNLPSPKMIKDAFL
jgi:hypothetical protein